MRTIVADDKVLFCGSDVARALGYAKPQNAIAQYCRNSTLKTPALNQGTNNEGANRTRLYIPEGNVYRLIVSSKLPGAAHLRFREKKHCESAIPVIFPPIGQKSYVYKAGVFAFDNICYFIVN